MDLANFINDLLALEGDEPEASAKIEIKYLTFLANHCPAAFSTPGRGLIRGVAQPALLCHKEPAQGTQSPLLCRGISCLSLVPDGISQDPTLGSSETTSGLNSDL